MKSAKHYDRSIPLSFTLQAGAPVRTLLLSAIPADLGELEAHPSILEGTQGIGETVVEDGLEVFL